MDANCKHGLPYGKCERARCQTPAKGWTMIGYWVAIVFTVVSYWWLVWSIIKRFL